MLALVISATLSLTAQAPQRDLLVYESYDRIKDDTRLSVALGNILEENALEEDETHVEVKLVAHYEGKGRNKPLGTGHIWFIGYSAKSWQYLEAHQIVLLVDDADRWRASPEHRGHVGDGFVLEQFAFPMTTARWRKLAEAKSIEGAIGIDKFTFTPNQMAAVRDFARYVTDSSLEVKPPASAEEEARATQADQPSQPKIRKGPTRMIIQNGTLRVGDQAALGRASDGDQGPCWISPQAFIQFWRDRMDNSKLELNDQTYGVIFVPKGTWVTVLEFVYVDFGDLPREEPNMARVRLTTEEHKDKEVWVTTNWILRFIPKEQEAADKSRIEKEERITQDARKAVDQRATTFLRAAQNFEKAKKAKMAIVYYRQVVREFPDTPQAKTAAERIKVLDVK
jgi:hypothetical protein